MSRKVDSAACRNWIDDRLGLEAVRDVVAKKTVPVHRHTIWYYFGGMTLFLFGIQAATGMLLLLYYRPSADGAFESVEFIMTQVKFGWLVRSIHSWSANLMIGALFVHMFSVFFLRSYRAPRELTWLSGVFLFFLSLAFGFSGYLLPWNTLAFFATKVGTEVAGLVPIAGGFLLRFLRGGDDVTGATLTRFYGFHVAILPAITIAMLGIHLLMVQRHGMSVPDGAGSARSMKFYPNFLLRDVIGWLTALGALAALSAIFPWELGEKADPFAPAPEGIRPEWFFMFMFQTLKVLPARIGIVDGELLGIVGFGLGGLALLLIPFVDAGNARVARALKIAGALALIYIAGMTVAGYWP